MADPVGAVAPEIGINPPGYDPEPQMRDFPDYHSWKQASEEWNHRNFSDADLERFKLELEERNRIIEENNRLDAERQALIDEEEQVVEDVVEEGVVLEEEEAAEVIEEEIPFGIFLGLITAGLIVATLVRIGYDAQEQKTITTAIGNLPPDSHVPDLPKPGSFDPSKPLILQPKYDLTPFHFLRKKKKLPFGFM